MTPQEFEKIVDKNKYQVFIFTCPGSIPFFFAKHPWFVVNKKGTTSRWEVIHKKSQNKTSWGHLHMNFLPPSKGIWVLPFWNVFEWYWQGKLLGLIEGDENSTAQKMADFIENSPTTYQYCKKYIFTGPNSNTYAQWILGKFPELKIKLPWNAFGKNYKKSA